MTKQKISKKHSHHTQALNTPGNRRRERVNSDVHKPGHALGVKHSHRAHSLNKRTLGVKILQE